MIPGFANRVEQRRIVSHRQTLVHKFVIFSLRQPRSWHSPGPVECDRRCSPRPFAGRWSFGSRGAVTTLVEPNPPWTSFCSRTPTWYQTHGCESDGAVVITPRVRVFNNRDTRSRLVCEEEVHFLHTQGAFQRLPQQRPITLGQRKQSLLIAQVTDQ